MIGLKIEFEISQQIRILNARSIHSGYLSDSCHVRTRVVETYVQSAKKRHQYFVYCLHCTLKVSFN
jgi:hypothetical protein